MSIAPEIGIPPPCGEWQDWIAWTVIPQEQCRGVWRHPDESGAPASLKGGCPGEETQVVLE
jgi:hypothetical protein